MPFASLSANDIIPYTNAPHSVFKPIKSDANENEQNVLELTEKFTS